MKIYNVSKHSIMMIVSLVLILLILFFIAMKLITPSTIIMTNENYTEILKDCHDKPYTYVNKKIISSGYIFRTSDFSDTRFVLARDMLINESESRIVGFLCEYGNANEFENNEWVSIEGILTLGDYHGEMPIIQVNDISRITTPNDIFVLPPEI